MPLDGSSPFEKNGLRPSLVNSPNGHLGNKMDGLGCFKPGNNIVARNRIQHLPNGNAEADQAPTLPHDHSLASSLAELSLHDAMGVVNNGTMDHELASIQFRQPPGLEYPSPSGDYNPQGGFLVRENERYASNMVNLQGQQLRAHHSGWRLPHKYLPGALHLPQQRMHDSQLPLNLPPSLGVELPSVPGHHQYFMAPQSLPPPPFMHHHQQLGQPEMSWSQYLEEERIHRMLHFQYLYYQQLGKELVEAEHLIQANGTSATRPISWNPRYSFPDIPISFQSELSNQAAAHWSRAAEFGRNQVVEKAGKHACPEKILMRSHGNGMNSMRSNNLGGFCERCYFNSETNHRGQAFSNGHHLLSPKSACLQGDTLSRHSSSPDSATLLFDSLRPPQLNRYESLEELTGRMHIIAKDQQGCRFLQKKLTEGTLEDVSTIFDGIISHIVDLSTDPFGNYVIQKLLEVCNEDQRLLVIRATSRKTGDLVKMSCDTHGTRVVQKIIETVKTTEQSSLIQSSLRPGVMSLIKNMNGNHVAQRCLQHFEPQEKQFIFEAAISHFLDLAKDRHGCCLLQKCLTYSDEENRRVMVSMITMNALTLSQDPFGNYVVQFVFVLQIPWATMEIIYQLENHYCFLSLQKHSSHVVEKCLKYGGEEGQSRIIREMIASSQFDQILFHQFGNYVIQAALSSLKGATHAALVNAIKPHLPMLRVTPFGKKLLSSNGLKKGNAWFTSSHHHMADNIR
ncbi:hypothetical protein Dimus_011623 [Dionaea muscipula]